MLFHSPQFLLFFLIFLPVFAFSPPPWRVWVTLAASYVFYAAWNPWYLLILILMSWAAYAAASWTHLSPARFGFLIARLCLPLIFFKYAGFIWENLPPLRAHVPEPPKIPLPLGISFITFTILAYLIDIRRGVYKTRETFGRTALYVAFFPHLIAGPIMRPRELFPQFAHLRFNRKLLKAGLLLFAVGVVKKTIFADSLARVVDAAYGAGRPLAWWESALAFYGFAVQIYCDFSGYVDMALGVALVLGVRLPLNFNRPYIAGSIREFWRRWHITLSRWLRDYLYISLGGSRKGPARTAVNLMLTMLIGGLWHGAAWTFVFWGGYHGALLALEHALAGKGPRVPGFLKKIFVFHLVAAGWVFFRARDFGQARAVFEGFASGGAPVDFSAAGFAFLLIAAFFLLHFWDRVSLVFWFAKRFPPLPVYGLALALLVIGFTLSVGSANAFIYFDF